MQLPSLIRQQQQALRFLAVGAVATVVDIALFNVLHAGLGTDPVVAKSLSTAASAVVAFIGNRHWSFATATTQPVGELRGQLSRYLVATVVSLGIALVPIEVCRSLLGLHGIVAMNIAANVVGLGLAMTFRFHAYRVWVFAANEAVPRRTALARG
jgi:putative flippase GtrA